MRNRYGDVLPVEILNRYLSELAELQETDIIVYFDLLSQIKSYGKQSWRTYSCERGRRCFFCRLCLGATEINPLKSHYFCPYCHKIEFEETTLCGWDLPAKHCSCGRQYLRDGHNLPFETLRSSIHRNVHFDISVSHGLYRAVKERIDTYFDGNTILTLIRKDHPNLETIVVVNEEISDLINGQELPFEEYYDRLRQYATITLMTNEDLDSFRLLEEKTKTSFENVDFACPYVLEAFQKEQYRRNSRI